MSLPDDKRKNFLSFTALYTILYYTITYTHSVRNVRVEKISIDLACTVHGILDIDIETD